jgi:tetratricopeptide (TPR) repeat protein
MNEPLTQGRIVFLSVPESLRVQMETGHHHEHGHEHFTIDPAIPLPVELPPGETSLNVEQLSWEMILSGMLRVVSISEGEKNPLFDLDKDDIDYYRRFVLEVKPGILEEFTEAALFKDRNGDHDMALEILAVLEGLFPRLAPVLLNRALVLEHRAEALEKAGREKDAENEYDRAYGAYKKVLALKPSFPDGLFNAGFFFMKRRNFDKARECFSACLAVEETVESAPLSDDKKKRAREIIREIESRSLDDRLFKEAYDFIRLGEEQKGLEKIREFLRQHPRVWNAWFILGWGLRRLSRWEDAAAAFTKALELGGNNSDTRNEMAICLMERGDYRAARRELEAALREEPENIKIISNLGVLAMRNGDNDEAAAFFRTVLELEPGDPIAREFFGNSR